MSHPTGSTRRRASIGHDAAKLMVSLAGVAFLVGGLTMLVVPGPGILAVTIGLALLATQFAWARRLLRRTEGSARAAIATITTDRKDRIVLAGSGIVMLLGGIAVAIGVPTWRTVGVFVGISGLISCIMLLPPVQAKLRAELADPASTD